VSRTLAPLGRRRATVTGHAEYGAYTVISCDDAAGPEPDPGQFYMLAAAERWGGGSDERPFLPRAFSVMRRHDDGTLDFLLEDVGPGTERLAELRPGDGLWLLGPLGEGFRRPEPGRRPLLVGGGVGIAPLAIWQDSLGPLATVLLGFRDAEHAHGAELLHRHRPAARGDRRRPSSHGLCLRAAADARGGARTLRGRAGAGAARARVGDGVRVRRLLRLRRADFCGIELEHPILNGSGTFDAIAAQRVFGDALLERFPFAAFVSKTVTVEPRQGNPPPRLWELPAGMINSIGLPNKGLAGYLEHDLPELARLPVPLIVNVMGFTRLEVARLVEAFGERDEVAALELNVSCPNVETGLIMGSDPGETGALVAAVRPLTRKPIIVKLTPNCSSPGAVAAAAEAQGADAVSLVNTLRGLAMHPHRHGERWLGSGERRGDEASGRGSGGISGPALRAVALAQVAEVREYVSVPIVGMGGVQSGRHAADLLHAGADLVAVGTESFRDPLAGARIAAELAEIHPNSGLVAAVDTRPRRSVVDSA
jgi:dihydroorotate dehydrogenase (NAD+) catalytic subunit